MIRRLSRKKETGLSSLGDLIRRVREAHGLNQEDFARVLQVSRASVQNYEAGRSRPLPAVLSRIQRIAPSEIQQRLHGEMKPNLAVLAERARGGKAPSSRIGEETRAQLFTALETILERAPSAVIEEVARVLTDRAGKYGGPR